MTAEETWARLCPFHFHLLTHQLSLQPLPFLVPLHGWTSEEASKVGIVEPGEYKAWELLFITSVSYLEYKFHEDRYCVLFTASSSALRVVWPREAT